MRRRSKRELRAIHAKSKGVRSHSRRKKKTHYKTELVMLPHTKGVYLPTDHPAYSQLKKKYGIKKVK